VNSNSTPSIFIIRWYCRPIARRGVMRTRTSSSSFSYLRVVPYER
jgi:hypothetical protein